MPIKCIKCQKDNIPDGANFCPACKNRFLRNGRYQDLQFLAQGAMGKIYKAIDTSFNNYVAIKERGLSQ